MLPAAERKFSSKKWPRINWKVPQQSDPVVSVFSQTPSQTGSKGKCPFLLPTIPIPEPVDAILVSGWENQARETGSIRVFLDFHLQHPLPLCRLQNATWTRSVMSPSVSGCHAIPNSSSEWLGPCLLSISAAPHSLLLLTKHS